MKESLGLVETKGLVAAITVADAMVKSANVNIIEVENTRGLGYMTVKISGDVGAVNAAVACGKQIAIENNYFISAKVIPRPSSNVSFAFCQTEKKKNNKNFDEINQEGKEHKNDALSENSKNAIIPKENDEINPKDLKISEMNDIDLKYQLENLEKDETHLDNNDETTNEDEKIEKIKDNNKTEPLNPEEKKSKRQRKKKADPKKE